MLRGGQKGFTLVELMIVVIVIGVLASVAIPMYQLSAERSRETECVTALGMVRSALRVYYAEHGTYANVNFADGNQVTAGGFLDVSDNDLLGRYFSTECYTFDGDAGANTFSIKCDGSASTAPQGSEVATSIRYIDQDGELTRG
jgi:prepilin-type N-terminal cleavage/methylation domain-containing protein/prepilin-type processing-associated H-X9-DG protein